MYLNYKNPSKIVNIVPALTFDGLIFDESEVDLRPVSYYDTFFNKSYLNNSKSYQDATGDYVEVKPKPDNKKQPN